jgi:histidine triad (HIT) family protein
MNADGSMKLIKRIGPLLVALVVGVVLGGYLFSETQARSFLALNHCEGNCLQPNELVGLVASVVVQKAPGLVPNVTKETARTIVIEHLSPGAKLHYVVIPKKDIKNVGELSEEDREYLIDMFNVSQEIIREKKLVDYQLVTNGPGYQSLTYLHFHLMGR